ncbi:hypothetical protein MA5_00890 [Rickettsia prowazekii str. GvV257]|nr:hypothetical protein M9W_03805 [Rickettsia prowazekii str. Chernikova]AFE50425.1 hypothetical protein M9Y_03810 [Rickettsia prowazekii str. Katsinyian]AFE51269.1 hypothetical protein MA1_03800 [Rickettsia prowazekii str. BuV67-CWPP]AFE52107.1 hypothetical protein MA3_03845 [Rickettsia prowazekii str. Dachau]AFE52367.1 hypothetical protein MA5_00890 [Rickettsia prowazekii str. GvV257]AFE53771.1 hypothetical protein MA7_03800 [Rickettsia prowazekii str. RpGvF24]
MLLTILFLTLILEGTTQEGLVEDWSNMPLAFFMLHTLLTLGLMLIAFKFGQYGGGNGPKGN